MFWAKRAKADQNEILTFRELLTFLEVSHLGLGGDTVGAGLTSSTFSALGLNGQLDCLRITSGTSRPPLLRIAWEIFLLLKKDFLQPQVVLSIVINLFISSLISPSIHHPFIHKSFNGASLVVENSAWSLKRGGCTWPQLNPTCYYLLNIMNELLLIKNGRFLILQISRFQTLWKNPWSCFLQTRTGVEWEWLFMKFYF